MLTRLARCIAAAFLLSFLLVQPVFARGSTKPVGPDIEDYHPPYSTKSGIKAWRSAFQSGEQATAERVARALLADALRHARSDGFAVVEARFMLGLTLHEIGRRTEAEGEFREGLAWLAEQISLHPRDGRPAMRSELALEWARYFEIHLLMNLRSQGRLREANQYQSIIPPELRPAPNEGSEPEVVGFGSLVGIATNLDLGTNGKVSLTEAQSAERQRLMAQVRMTSQAADLPGYYKAWQAVLAFDEPRHGAMGEQTAFDLVRVSEAALDLGQAVEAQTLAVRAERILEGSQDRSNLLASALLAQARAIETGGNPAGAEPLLRRALSLRFQDRNPWMQMNLGANLFAQGRLAESEAQYRGSLEKAGLPPATRNEVRIFAGFLALRQGESARGMADYRAVCSGMAEQVAQQSRGSRATLASSYGWEAARDCSIRQALAAWDWAQTGGGQASSDTPSMLREEGFVAAQSAHSDPSAAALARAGARAVAERAGMGALVAEYEQTIAKRDSLRAAPPEDWLNADYTPFPAERQTEIDHLNTRIAELSGSLAKAAPRFWDLRAPRPLDLGALQARSGPDAVLLGRDEAVISFMIPNDGRHGLVFAVTKSAIAWAQLPFDRAELLGMIKVLRAQIDPRAYGLGKGRADVGIGQRGFDRALAWKLYQGLFGDRAIQSAIASKPNWIIVPSGPITMLPPALLLTARPEGSAEGDDDPEILRRAPWLVRSKALTLLPSVASLRTVRQILPRERRAPNDPLLALVGPDFSGSLTPSDEPAPTTRAFTATFRDGLPDISFLEKLRPLAHAKEEGMALMAALKAPASSVLFGKAASKAELMARNRSGLLARIRVLEFATHGFAAGEGDGAAEPMLLLSAASRPEDWVLRASDAAGLTLNADWVILSGCNTASPEAAAADGLSGFARAFFFAGASSLLVSHWRLDDEIAARLVPSTLRYQRQHPGTSKAQALRHAMLEIIDDPKLNAPHPAFWAPLTLIGEPQ